MKINKKNKNLEPCLIIAFTAVPKSKLPKKVSGPETIKLEKEHFIETKISYF